MRSSALPTGGVLRERVPEQRAADEEPDRAQVAPREPRAQVRETVALVPGMLRFLLRLDLVHPSDDGVRLTILRIHRARNFYKFQGVFLKSKTCWRPGSVQKHRSRGKQGYKP